MDWEVAGKPGEQGTSDGGVPKPHKGGKGRVVLIVVVALVAVFAVMRRTRPSNDASSKSLDWPTSGLATRLPSPDTNKGEVTTNSDTMLSATLAGYDDGKYDSYVKACQDKGFTVDEKKDSTSFEAYDGDGYHLRLSHYSSKEELSLTLQAPEELGTLTWPKSGAGSQVPAPKSTTGKIQNDSSTYFTATVGDTSKDDYAAYVESLVSAGFTVDYSKSDAVFTGKNSSGVKVRAEYAGNELMHVTVSVPDDAAATDSSAGGSANASATSSADSSAVTPSFKETMDSYEAFMNEYIDFVAKYNSASAADQASMAADYTSLLAKEADWVTKVSNLDDGSLSAADAAYYAEVTARVSKRAAEASVSVQ